MEVVGVYKQWKRDSQVKQRVLEERRQLRKGLNVAKSQWQYGQMDYNQCLNKFDISTLLERRYMYLYQVAKRRNIHALEQ
jgi:hypothetical protein